MTMKTNFSFELQYPAQSGIPAAQREAVMAQLAPLLAQLMSAGDASAHVAVNDSHKGNDNKIVTLTTTLQDAQIAAILQTFSAQHGVTINALE